LWYWNKILEDKSPNIHLLMKKNLNMHDNLNNLLNLVHYMFYNWNDNLFCFLFFQWKENCESIIQERKKKKKKKNYFDKLLMNQNNLWDIHQNNFYYKVPIIFVIEGTIKKKLKWNKLTFGEIQDKQLEFDGPSHVSHPVSHAITNFWRKKKEEKKIIKIWNWDKEIMKLIKNNETKKQRKEKNFTLTKIRWIDENWKRFWRTWSNTFFC